MSTRGVAGGGGQSADDVRTILKEYEADIKMGKKSYLVLEDGVLSCSTKKRSFLDSGTSKITEIANFLKTKGITDANAAITGWISSKVAKDLKKLETGDARQTEVAKLITKKEMDVFSPAQIEAGQERGLIEASVNADIAQLSKLPEATITEKQMLPNFFAFVHTENRPLTPKQWDKLLDLAKGKSYLPDALIGLSEMRMTEKQWNSLLTQASTSSNDTKAKVFANLVDKCTNEKQKNALENATKLLPEHYRTEIYTNFAKVEFAQKEWQKAAYYFSLLPVEEQLPDSGAIAELLKNKVWTKDKVEQLIKTAEPAFFPDEYAQLVANLRKIMLNSTS